jgi:hypothetical protein
MALSLHLIKVPDLAFCWGKVLLGSGVLAGSIRRIRLAERRFEMRRSWESKDKYASIKLS